jgi:hypothetical protein
MSTKQIKNADQQDPSKVDKARRDFLRNSVYAAYATPLITILLVDTQSAAASNNGRCSPRWCINKGLPPGCCD